MRGFSLIELMIVILIIGILASVAIPAYHSYVMRSRLQSVQHFLLGLTLELDHYHRRHHTYEGFDLSNHIASFKEDGLSDFYRVELDGLTTTTYMLQAESTTNDKCYLTKLNQYHQHQVFNQSGENVTDSCWKVH